MTDKTYFFFNLFPSHYFTIILIEKFYLPQNIPIKCDNFAEISFDKINFDEISFGNYFLIK